MCKITSKSIPKILDAQIRRHEKEFLTNDLLIDSKLNTRIESEISHLGKERLLVDTIAKLSKEKNTNKKVLNQKILYLLIKLYKFNKEVHYSLKKELKEDKRELKKRVNHKINNHSVHEEIQTKLLKIANVHFDKVKKHAETFKSGKIYPKQHLMKVVYHHNRADSIYTALSKKNIKELMRKVLLVKIDRVYVSLIGLSVELATEINSTILAVNNNKTNDFNKCLAEIDFIVQDKIKHLRNFAFKYSYNIIHSEEFFDNKGNRLILATKTL